MFAEPILVNPQERAHYGVLLGMGTFAMVGSGCSGGRAGGCPGERVALTLRDVSLRVSLLEAHCGILEGDGDLGKAIEGLRWDLHQCVDRGGGSVREFLQQCTLLSCRWLLRQCHGWNQLVLSDRRGSHLPAKGSLWID